MSLKLDGSPVAKELYEVSEKLLMVRDLPQGAFTLEVETELKPQVSWGLLFDVW